MVPSFCRGCGRGEVSCDGDLPAEDLSPILVQGLEPDALHGHGRLPVHVELAAALGVSDTQPVGRLIARSEETRALNPAARQWLDSVANVRVHGETHQRPLDLFALERDQLRPLPELLYDVGAVHTVRASNRFRVTRAPGSSLRVSVEIAGNASGDGYPADIVETVEANARDLKLGEQSWGFEKD